MKQIGIALILTFGLISIGCGGSSSSAGNINGNWTANLTDPNNSSGPAFAFKTTFTQSSGSGVTVTNFSFITENDSCFGSAGTEAGTFSLAGNFNGNVTGTFGLIIQSANPSGNTLTLSNGAVTGNTIAGTWTLTNSTNSGCSGSGTFTFNKG